MFKKALNLKALSVYTAQLCERGDDHLSFDDALSEFESGAFYFFDYYYRK